MPNRYQQYSLRTLCLSLLACSIAMGVYQWRRSTVVAREKARVTPIEWTPFTQKRLEESISDGRPVLVVYYAHWKPRPLWRIETEEFRILLHNQRMLAVDGNYWTNFPVKDEIVGAIQKLGMPTDGTIFGVIYKPDEEPTIFDGYPDKLNENAINALTDI